MASHNNHAPAPGQAPHEQPVSYSNHQYHPNQNQAPGTQYHGQPHPQAGQWPNHQQDPAQPQHGNQQYPNNAPPQQQYYYQYQGSHPQQPPSQRQATYLHTAPGQVSQTPQVAWAPRPHMPEHMDIPDEAKKRHEESMRFYPDLNLSPGEFIISAVRRHPIGLISIWFTSGLVIALSIGIVAFTFFNQGAFSTFVGEGSSASLVLLSVGIALLLSALSVLGGFIATYVYKQNKFFLTNESVIQYIQTGLFSRREQTVSLLNIEDASYRQHGIVQHIFNFGNIRLSTQGEETTYRFNYVENPKHQIALLNNAVEAFKNGRPVMSMDD